MRWIENELRRIIYFRFTSSYILPYFRTTLRYYSLNYLETFFFLLKFIGIPCSVKFYEPYTFIIMWWKNNSILNFLYRPSKFYLLYHLLNWPWDCICTVLRYAWPCKLKWSYLFPPSLSNSHLSTKKKGLHTKLEL